MDKLKRITKIWNDGLFFKIFYFLLTLFAFNSITSHRSYMFYVSIFVTLIGITVFVYRIMHYKKYIQTKNLMLLGLFCISYIISMFANIKYGILENFQGLIWFTFQFFLLHACDVTRTKNDYKKEFHLISYIFLIYTFLSAIISFLMLLYKYNNIRHIAPGLRVINGFIWGRLWGVYTDPNYGAIFSVVSIILSVYFLILKKNIAVKVLLSVNILIQLLHSTFSDSRTALICLSITLPIYLSLVLYNSDNLKKYKFKALTNKIICLSLCAITFLFCISSNYAIKRIYNQFNSSQSVVISSNNKNTSNATKTNSNKIGRPDDIKDDITNRRSSIWKSAIEIFLSKPITGVSFRNIVPYSKDVIPNTYIVNNDYSTFASLHNTFFDVLASQGVIGILIILSFVVLTIAYFIKKIRYVNHKDIFYILTLISAILPIIISMMFYSEVIYMNTAGAFIFWCFGGYLIHFLKTTPNITNEKNIKTGILTFHRARNIGGCLQALALQTYIQNLGSYVEIFDYRPDFIEDSFGVFVKDLYRKAKNSKKDLIVFFIKTVIKFPLSCIREYKFMHFRNKFFNLSPIDMYDLSQLESNVNYDLMIFGSDQIWNPIITKGFAYEYFGNFSNSKSINASYAASIGLGDIEAYKENFKEGLSHLDFISVREQTAKNLISNLTEKNVSVVIDPTLLLDKSQWAKLINKKHACRKYVLVYALEINEELIKSANKIALEKNLPVLFFDIKNRYTTSVIRKYTANPIEFLYLIRDAEYIVTNSFHGTVFSVIFEKLFLCIPHKTTSSRTTDLLDSLGLNDRILYSFEGYKSIYNSIEYDIVSDKLSNMRKQSEEFIKQIIDLKEETNNNE